jgi:bifunctional UDP-N-acetylglucosamine pyrophosphorylase/glucosamine-1-phosphate N-acetyltransferase
VPQQPLHIVVLAAGQGKRMHSALPKVLHLLGGRPIIDYVLAAARSLGPARIAVVIGHEGDRVAHALGTGASALARPERSGESSGSAPGRRPASGDPCDLVLVRQDPPRGTGDAVRLALAELPAQGVTLVMICDAPLVRPEDLAALAAEARGGALALLTARVPDPTGLGRILRDAGGQVRAIVEERDADAEVRCIDEINSGMLAAPTELLSRWVQRLGDDNAQREFLLTDIVAMAVREGTPVRSRCVADERDVRGINDRAQLVELERILQRRRADALLVAGTWIADPSRIEIRGTLTCGRDVRIDVNCVFEGEVVLGDGAEVGANCVLRNTHVGAGTRIAPFTHCEDATIGAECRIGPYTRLRPGATLADEVHIGNFVEVKAATVGPRSKANHLAYVGDAAVGADVNIGAGTITCNYDGANKHRTVIEDGAFIGSDTQLVAPVRVGRNATIGAGTTVTRDAPAEALTVSRAKQVSVAGWKRPVKEKR